MSNRKKVIIGFPTYCESGSIKKFVELVDRVVCAGTDDFEVVLVNSDNSSPDKTVENFLEAETRSPKVAIQTAEEKRGKGFNLLNLFEFSLKNDADVLICLDADLEAIGSDWIYSFCKPIFKDEADYVAPLYRRFWYDGNQTNQTVTPLIVARTGVPIRQPTGGEFAYSRRAMEHFLSLNWSEYACTFGGDVFCLLNGMKSLRVVQAPLSIGKIHSWRSETVEELTQEMIGAGKFEQTIGMVLDELVNWKDPIPEVIPDFPIAPPLGRKPKNYDYSHLVEASRIFYEQNKENKLFWKIVPVSRTVDPPKLNDEDWASVMVNAFRFAENNQLNDEFFSLFTGAFYLRIISVLPELNDTNTDEKVMKVAKLINKKLKNDCLSFTFE